MHLIILPGNSKEYNEQWLYDSEKNYKDLFDSTTTHVFKHWETGEDMIDIPTEVEKLIKEVEGKDDYVIFAKSAGTQTTATAVAEGKISPKKCVFVGSPWGGLSKDILSKYNIPTLFIQQTDDMFFKYPELEKLLKGSGIQNYKLIETPGNNHAYDNYDEIKGWIKEFV